MAIVTAGQITAAMARFLLTRASHRQLAGKACQALWLCLLQPSSRLRDSYGNLAGCGAMINVLQRHAAPHIACIPDLMLSGWCILIPYGVLQQCLP